MPMTCKLCGFTAAENPKARAGSMALHAKMKHGELDYHQIFEAAPGSEKPPADNAEKKPPTKKPNAAPKNHWRLLNPKNADEKRAIEKGFTKVNAVPNVDPDEWDIA